MNKMSIIRSFNGELDETNLKIVDLFDKAECKGDYQESFIKDLDKLLTRSFNTLKERLEGCSVKINTAVFGDKKFINEAYAYEIPIEKEYFETEDLQVKFKDNILMNESVKPSKDNKIPLDIKSIVSKKNTSFKFINKVIQLDKNEFYSYQELQINLPKETKAGLMHIEFDSFNSITVLNRYGKEIASKVITKSITQPISTGTEAIILRFNSNEKKDLNLIEFYVSENTYNLESTLYTKPIGIFQQLKEIAINTCDNYSDQNSELKYEISLNSGEFREIRPLNKQKNLDINSVISVDETLTYSKLEQAIYTEDLRLYTTDHLKNQEVNLIKSFEFKLGDDLGLITTEEFYIDLKSDISLTLKVGEILYYDDTKFESILNNTTLNLKKGFHKLKISSGLFNQEVNMLRYELLEVNENTLKLRSTTDSKIVYRVREPEQVVKTSIFLQLVFKADFYVNSLNEKPYYINDKLYFTKSSNNDAHVFFKYKTNFINTAQLKITMKSRDKISPVYISSLTLRGI